MKHSVPAERDVGAATDCFRRRLNQTHLLNCSFPNSPVQCPRTELVNNRHYTIVRFTYFFSELRELTLKLKRATEMALQGVWHVCIGCHSAIERGVATNADASVKQRSMNYSIATLCPHMTLINRRLLTHSTTNTSQNARDCVSLVAVGVGPPDKSHKYVCITTYQPDTKSNPNPNLTTKQHGTANIQLNIFACLTYPDTFVRDMLSHSMYYFRLQLGTIFRPCKCTRLLDFSYTI